MILVAGATGNIGRPLVHRLREAGAGPLLALTRDPARAGGDMVVGDLTRPDSLKSALAGVRSLFLPAGMGAEAEVLAAAREAGVEHVVLVSSITVLTHPHLGPAAANAATERALRESGLAWTILRPTQFASNALWWAPALQAGKALRLPFPEAALPTIHPADIATMAAAALLDPAHHRGHAYALTGPALVTAREQVETLGEVLGREARWEPVSRETAHAEMAASLGDEPASALLDVTGGDLNPALTAVHDTVPRLTGHPGRTFRQWAEENAAAFR
ncbi:NAD(P)H-binding protein [Streptomyces mayteni]